ncbi:asparagine synthase (glutamine-hydrolyzing) [Aliarcobacter cryaerophilus]|uniref:asparagine synthase (glutamine-hydrolyzing) n=1 Tax=Aliarcobacter cryaerophilus TaxID=28198 RepID=UPI0021B66A59|nr:asparagine synthase (glutamine-hydrolyzing) [Aliarcobacter cryaerophilus]MCT7492508.1 asparagine synthase (glutamine-hydrolyzing) [Aliarcobacter cryaerophilus]
MCGIVGFSNSHFENKQNILKSMADSISHRGPDAEGFFVDKKIAFGHRRLSIIDIEGGIQPFYDETNRYVLIYNGESYNFKELRDDLKKIGYSFSTNSDTEVILKLYIEFKEEAFLKINGMFALAIYDKKEQKIILARDRHGVKPLYYAIINQNLVFASEIKAILKHPEYKKELEYNALNEYFSFQNIFSDLTFYKDIKKLEHGCYLIFDVNTKQFDITQYWDFNFDSSSWQYNEEETIEILKDTFSKAVKRQMVSDVPIGSYLSGGIDSGSITAIAASNIPRLSTFTCGFDLSEVSGLELDFDERRYAELISAKFYTKHHEVVLNSKDLEWCIDDVMYYLDEPVLGMSYPNYYVSELASKYVKVVFSGAGGDELFGGYPWRYYHTTNNGLGKDNYIKSYYDYWQRLVPDVDKEKLFTKEIYDKMDKDWPFEAFKNVFKNYKGKLETEEDYINKSLYFEAKTFLQGLFYLDDKLNMSHGVESRVPFMDNDLVELAQKIPAKYKIKNLSSVIKLDENETGKSKKYYIQSHDGKNILRKALSELLPKEVVELKKQGFSAPDESWMRGSRKEYIENILGNSNLEKIFNMNYFKNKFDEHVNHKQNNRLLLWSLVSINSFFYNEGKES